MRPVLPVLEENVLDVAGLMAGKRLVVLGGTGFLGKIFWSMLLDRYPSVGQIFLVVRAKGHGSPEKRFWSDIANAESVAPLRRAHGDAFEAFLRDKVVPVDGDMGLALCGMGAALVTELRGTIDAVINVAGVVDFNPPLDEALDANAFGAQNLVALARALGDAPIMHTSTCYVAGNRRGLIREEHPCAVPFPRSAELGAGAWNPEREIAECLDLVAQATHRCGDAFRQSEFAERARSACRSRDEPSQGAPYERELSRIKRKFVSERLVEAGLDRATHWGWPNIYTYTKAIGEQVIAKSGLPFTIARPACCESTVAYPERGYNEGINTSAPLIYLIMKGEPQILGGEVPLDFIPADYVVGGMILALAELLEGSAKAVYQFAAADVNPCSVQRFGELVGLYKRKHYRHKGSGNFLFNALQARYEPVFVDRARFDAVGPAAVARVARGLASAFRTIAPGLQPAAKALDQAASRMGKAAAIQELFSPFTTAQIGPFDCSNTRAAHARLTDEDRARLLWAPESIDWADWMMNVHMPAMEKRILPEMDRRLEKATRPLAAHATLVSLLDELADRHDFALALQGITDEGFTRTTFRALKRRSECVAARLTALGVAKGDRVALAAQNHPDWAIAHFGILRAGATTVPVDPALDAPGWAAVIADSGARVALWDGTVKARDAVAATSPRGGRFAGFVGLDLHAACVADESLTAPNVAIHPDDIASLVYTSGTTGKPKGALLSHANFTSLIAALAPIFPLTGADVVFSVLPLHHTFELTCGLLLPLSRGARVVYPGEVSGDRIAKGLHASRATAMVGVPALWQLLERRILQRVDARGPLARAAFDVAAEANRWLVSNMGVDAGRVLFGSVHAGIGGRVRWLISGGGALPPETQRLFTSIGLRLTEGYGPTEAAPVLTVARPGKRPERGVGQPLPGIQVEIRNPDEAGVGEVVARGPSVMIGYTDERATAEAIDAEGWLHTGDLGRLDRHGRLEILGRPKDVVIAPTGENVYPEDVEHRLGAIPHIAELAVVGVEVQGAERLACLAVAAGENGVVSPDRDERARSALHKAIGELPPSQRPAIVHLADTPLPRTPTRKVKRDEVRAAIARAIAAAGRADESTAETEAGGALRLQGCVTVADVEALVRDGPSSNVRPTGPVGPARGVSIRLPEPIQELGRAALGKMQDFFYGEIMKPEVRGRAHIPHNRNVIVVANHASHLDMGLVRHALGTYGEDIVSLAADDYFFEDGLRRAFFENLTNLKPIDRNGSLRDASRQANDLLSRGKTVLVFPEAARGSGGEVGEFKPLVGYLALAHGVDILPIFVGGTHAAMPKGAKLPVRRQVLASIGPALPVVELQRAIEGMSPSDAAREVSRIARAAVIALRAGTVLDVSNGAGDQGAKNVAPHPLVKLFGELEAKFRAGEVSGPVSYYVTLGTDELAKWTVRVDATGCHVRPGKPEGGQADCVLKTSPEIFSKIVREAYTPSPSDFLSGAVKSNDVGLLLTFQKVFRLDQSA